MSGDPSGKNMIFSKHPQAFTIFYLKLNIMLFPCPMSLDFISQAYNSLDYILCDITTKW